MSQELIRKVREAAAQSDLVQAITSIRRDGGRSYALGDAPLRPLYDDEIAQLEKRCNSCDDWSRVRVADGFDWHGLSHCHLQGEVFLGRFVRQVKLADGVELPAGIHQATLANCIVANDVLIRDVGLLANYVVGPEAVLFRCGSIACDGRTNFGNGASLPIGVESGGREVPVYAEIDLEVASAVARMRAPPGFLADYAGAVADYTAQVISNRAVIGAGALVQNTPTVRNTFAGPFARIDGATLVVDSTILSSAEEPTHVESGACVRQALLQWGSRTSMLAIVERSVLAEHAHVDDHGKVAHSIVGPNTSIAQGEVTSCLVGPFVNAHHQSLLIATVWPEGKGNVSYGAKVGSNHTAKAPDQECWPGEGMFFGLGVNVKFPSDFRKAPYTVLASGVTTLPQRIEFPFSLINLPSRHFSDLSPAYNEIIPAWLLAENLYAVKRNEAKQRARNRARRHQLEYRVFRRDLIDLLRDACRRLEAIPRVQDVYTDRDVVGLGKNFLLEANRLRAIASYQFFIRYYALMAFKGHLEAALRSGNLAILGQILTVPGSEPGWEHARRILSDELQISDPVRALLELSGMLEKIALDVERSKAKDDERGTRIVDDYALVHVDAARDPFVQQTWEETRCLQREIAEVVARLEAHPSLNGKQPPSEIQIMIA